MKMSKEVKEGILFNLKRGVEANFQIVYDLCEDAKIHISQKDVKDLKKEAESFISYCNKVLPKR